MANEAKMAKDQVKQLADSGNNMVMETSENAKKITDGAKTSAAATAAAPKKGGHRKTKKKHHKKSTHNKTKSKK